MSTNRNVQGNEAEGWAARTVRARFPIWNWARIGLAIGVAALLAWLPPTDEVKALRPAHHAPGISPSPIIRLAFAPDAQTIATVDDRERIELRRLDGSGSTIPIDGVDHVKAIAFSPDGRYLAVGRRETDVVLLSLHPSVTLRKLNINVKETSDLTFSPDGTLLAISSHASPRIVIWEIAAGRARTLLAGHQTPAHLVRFAPDGQSLVSVAINDCRLLTWDLSSGRPRNLIDHFASRPNCLAYAPNGRRLATSCFPRAVQIWDLATGREVVRISGLRFPARSLAFSPDGSLLAASSGDGSAGLWDASTGQPIRRLETGLDVLNAIAFSPDGLRIALSGNDSALRLWDVATLFNPSARSD